MRNSLKALLVVLLCSLLLSCTGGRGGDDAAGGNLNPGTILSGPYPTLPGIGPAAFSLSEAQLPGGSGLSMLSTVANSHDFTLILLQTNEIIESQCLIGEGGRIFTLDVVYTEFGYVHLIDPVIDPLSISVMCGIRSIFLPVLPGNFLQTNQLPVTLGVGAMFTTLPEELQQEIHDGADYFLLVSNVNNQREPYRLVQPFQQGEEYSFYIPGLRQEFLRGDDIKMRLLRRDATDTLDFRPTTVELVDPPAPVALNADAFAFTVNNQTPESSFHIPLVQASPTSQLHYNCHLAPPETPWYAFPAWGFASYSSILPLSFDPLASMLFCSSTLTYQPAFSAGKVMTRSAPPVRMQVRGEYMFPEDSFQEELRSSSYSMALVITQTQQSIWFERAWPLRDRVVVPFQDYYHFPDSPPSDINYTFYSVFKDAVAAQNGDPVEFHLLRFYAEGIMERIPMVITEVVECQYRIENNRLIEICPP